MNGIHCDTWDLATKKSEIASQSRLGDRGAFNNAKGPSGSAGRLGWLRLSGPKGLTWKQMWTLLMVICSLLSTMADRWDRKDHAKPLPSGGAGGACGALAARPGEPH